MSEVSDEDVVRTLQRFADHDLHGLIPHSEIANEWYHRGLDAAQREASEWAERIGMETP